MTKKKPALSLDAERLFRAMEIVKTENIRFYLEGVHIEPIKGGGVWMIATNGAVMLIQRDRDGRADHATTLTAIPPKTDLIRYDDGTVEGEYHWCGGRITLDAINPGEPVVAPVIWRGNTTGPHVLVTNLPEASVHQYPDWRRAVAMPIHAEDESASGCIAVGAIDLLIRGRNAFCLRGNLEDMSQVQVTYPDDYNSLGLLMKRRMSTAETAYSCPDIMLAAIGRNGQAT